MDPPELETNGFHDWESLPSTHSPTHTHNLSLHRNNHRRDDHFTVFPPVNHEGLPIPPLPPPPQTPPSLQCPNSNLDSSSPSSPPLKPPFSHFVKWFYFVLRLCNAKLLSVFTLLRSYGFFSSLLPVAFTASFLGFLWFLVRRRWRLRGGDGNDSVEHLKLVIKEKDEKIVGLLEQIADLNRVLLARYKIPILRSISS